MSDNITFSRAETSMIMDPMYSNAMGNVHGGELMKIMDNIAGIAAIKHSKDVVVTARVDEILFHQPVHVGDIITCIGQVAYVGKTSLQVFIELLVHKIDDYDKPQTATTAFFTMVHMRDGKPAAVPPLVIKTEADKALFAKGEKKHFEIKRSLKA